MTKFEQIGVEYQLEAYTCHEANKSFKRSCECCVTKGMNLSCDRCAIKQAHLQTIACILAVRELSEPKKVVILGGF